MESLDHLLTTRQDIWRGAVRSYWTTLSTGQPDLDAWLPNHGWPCGHMVALHAQHVGSGELSILLPFLASQTQQKLPVLLISPPLIPCPHTLKKTGIALEHLVVVRSREKQLWVAEQVLKSGLCGALVIWPSTQANSSTAMRRLQLACERGRAPVFLVEYKTQSCLSWPCTLFLKVEPGLRISWLKQTSTEHKPALALQLETQAS